MSHENKKSLVLQVKETLESMLKIGGDKHADKETGEYKKWIYSWVTFKTYMKHCNYFVKYCKQEHRCKTIEECRPYVDEWLLTLFDLSPYSIKLKACAVAKMYHCSITDFVKTPKRSIDNIRRSRMSTKSDVHFNEALHRDFVDFCKGTGLRRSEAMLIEGKSLRYFSGKPYLSITEGTKGGRYRYAPIIGEVDKIVSMLERAGKDKVFENVPKHADIHSYRADYAKGLYGMYARNLETCKKERFWNKEHYNGKGKKKGGYDRDSVYRCRGKRLGKWFDKKAMGKVSKALGHNRISIVGEHYLWNEEDYED